MEIFAIIRLIKIIFALVVIIALTIALPLWVENLPDSEISDYYKSNLTEYQYRIMPKINEEIIDELVEKVKKIKRESR